MTKEHLALRVSRLQRLINAAEERFNKTVWSPCGMCRKSGERRAAAHLRRIREFVDSLESDALLFSIGAYR